VRSAIGFDTQTFRRSVSDISEYDYGDFMRSASPHLMDLRNELHLLSDKNIDRRINKMQNYLVFTPNWDVESTREHLEVDTKYLDELLQGHNQDWESANN
jgi:hypothetical protein